MKNLKISLRQQVGLTMLILAVFTLLSSTTSAQKPGNGGGRGGATPEERAVRLTDMMKEALNLTTAQEPKVAAINLKYAKKNEEVRKISDTTLQRKTLQANNKQKDGELKVVLTPDQFKTYQKQVAEMKARRGNGAKNRP